jgi:hypothetical protein
MGNQAMFEDFKHEIRRHNSEKAEPQSLPPEVVAKLQSQGLDPETVTMKQLFPETLDEGGNDLSLMSGAEWEIMITYAKTRKYLLEKYPQSQEEARMCGQEWAEEPQEPHQINVAKAREDPQRRLFVKALFQNAADEFHVKVAQNLDEACKLLEVGFEYVTEIDGAQIFRKRE